MMANKKYTICDVMGCAEPFEVIFFLLILTDWYAAMLVHELPRCLDVEI